MPFIMLCACSHGGIESLNNVSSECDVMVTQCIICVAVYIYVYSHGSGD